MGTSGAATLVCCGIAVVSPGCGLRQCRMVCVCVCVCYSVGLQCFLDLDVYGAEGLAAWLGGLHDSHLGLLPGLLLER